MHLRRFILSVGLASVATLALAKPAAKLNFSNTDTTKYQCNGPKKTKITLQVDYYGGEKRSVELVVITAPGQEVISLVRAFSASGTRYVSGGLINEDHYQWWTAGSGNSFTKIDGKGRDVLSYEDCVPLK